MFELRQPELRPVNGIVNVPLTTAKTLENRGLSDGDYVSSMTLMPGKMHPRLERSQGFRLGLETAARTGRMAGRRPSDDRQRTLSPHRHPRRPRRSTRPLGRGSRTASLEGSRQSSLAKTGTAISSPHFLQGAIRAGKTASSTPSPPAPFCTKRSQSSPANATASCTPSFWGSQVGAVGFQPTDTKLVGDWAFSPGPFARTIRKPQG